MKLILTAAAVLALIWQTQVTAVADSKKADAKANRPKTIRVAVIAFNPYCPGHGNKRTNEIFGWGDPHTLVEGYINDLKTASGGWCQYKVVSFYDADYYPVFTDGFKYDPDDYVEAWKISAKTTWHKGVTDYDKVMCDKSYPHNKRKSLAERVASGDVDEVFLLAAPASTEGSGEISMAGPSPFFVNGTTFKVPSARRNFCLMNFNYERGVDCMLEDFCHRTECIMSRVYKAKNSWFPTWPVTNNWDRFRMIDKVHPGDAACGFCHYAPNSTGDYDWGNTSTVYSTCDDWLYNWPDLKGEVTKRLVTSTEWGKGDMRQHHVWWLTHFPKAAGVNPDGKQNNWWKYTCDFNSYPESR